MAWIFKASEDETKVVDQEMDALLGYREACATFLPLLKALSGCMGALSVHGEAWGGHLLPDLLADVEDNAEFPVREGIDFASLKHLYCRSQTQTCTAS